MLRHARYYKPHNAAAGLVAIERALQGAVARGGTVVLVRVAVTADSDPAGRPLAELAVPDAEVDGVALAEGDLVLLARDDDGADAGVWVVKDADEGGPTRPVFTSPLGGETALAYANAPGMLVYASEGEVCGRGTFVCTAVDAETAAATFQPAATALAGAGGPAPVLGIDDLTDATCRSADGVLVMGSTKGVGVGTNNVLIGTAAGQAMLAEATDNTVIGNHAGTATAAGRVVVADGAGNAALAVVSKASATWLGPAAQRVFDAAAGAAVNTTWIGGASAADVTALPPTGGATVVADGKGQAVLAAVKGTRNNAWIGPGCKRLFSQTGTANNSVWLGGTADGDVVDGHGDAVVVADGAGNAALAAQPARGNAWLGPGARKLFRPGGAASTGNTFVGDVPASEVDAGRSNAVVVADGAGSVRIRALGQTVQVGPHVNVGVPPPTDGCTLVGTTVGNGGADEVAVADGKGTRHHAFCDASQNAALGGASAAVMARAKAAGAGKYAGHTAIGSVAPPQANPNDATPGAAYVGAVAVSDGGNRLALYADAERVWMGPTVVIDGVTSKAPPETPRLDMTDAGATGVARHGLWIGRPFAEDAGRAAGPVTIADPNTGGIRWHCDPAGLASWSTPEGFFEPPMENMMCVAVHTLHDAPYSTLVYRAPGEPNGLLCPMGPLLNPIVRRAVVAATRGAAGVWTAAPDRPAGLVVPPSQTVGYGGPAGGAAAALRAGAAAWTLRADAGCLVFPFPFLEPEEAEPETEDAAPDAPPQLVEATVFAVAVPEALANGTDGTDGTDVYTLVAKGPGTGKYEVALELVVDAAAGTARARVSVGAGAPPPAAGAGAGPQDPRPPVRFESARARPLASAWTIGCRVQWNRVSLFLDGDGEADAEHFAVDGGAELYPPPEPGRLRDFAVRVALVNQHALCVGAALLRDPVGADGALAADEDAVDHFNGCVCAVEVVPAVLSDAACAARVAELAAQWTGGNE